MNAFINFHLACDFSTSLKMIYYVVLWYTTSITELFLFLIILSPPQLPKAPFFHLTLTPRNKRIYFKVQFIKDRNT